MMTPPFGLSRKRTWWAPSDKDSRKPGYVEGRNVATEFRWAEGQLTFKAGFDRADAQSSPRSRCSPPAIRLECANLGHSVSEIAFGSLGNARIFETSVHWTAP